MTRLALAAAAALLLAAGARAAEDPIARAQELLFARRWREAEAAYAALARERPADPAVLRGLARTAYWSGDWRKALPRFRALERAVPGDPEAREALAAFAILMRPVAALEARLVDDDQPSRLVEGLARGGVWLDPLTLVLGEASGGRLSARDLPERGPLSRARVGISAKLPAAGLALEAWAGGLRVDGRSRILGSLALSRELPRGWKTTLAAERDATLDSAFSYASAVERTQLSLRVARGEGGLTGAAEARGLWYADGNAGLSLWGWGEARLLAAGPVIASVGAALAWRDTRETRTRALFAGAVPNGGGGWDYGLRTVFDPYVTPERQLEARVIAHLTARPAAHLRVDLSGDWGVGRERATGWGPTSGYTPEPGLLAPGTFARSYHPWRASLSLDAGSERRGVRAEVVRSLSAFYAATTVTLSLRGTL